MEEFNPYELIAKYLASQCTDQEVGQLQAWRSASTYNDKLYSELRDEWNLIHTNVAENPIIPDKEIVWNQVQRIIKSKSKTYTKSFLIRVASVAAVIALIVGVSASFWLTSSNVDKTLTSTFVSPIGHKSLVLMADGTKVWLNSGSKLSYTNRFGSKDRAVKLEGEAFFDVKKDMQLKFIVETGSVDVVVHGTAFNVKSYSKEEDVAVSLLRGSVELISSEDDHRITLLTPGERVVVDKSDLKFRKEECDANLDGIWRMDKLKFEGATIAEVATKLGKWYGVNIVVKDSTRFQKYWFTVKSESLRDILESMNGLHPINYSFSTEGVVISSR